jgi:TATA-box binding protein (TBP) (component of TFIID and TFIIIB)
MQLRQLWWKGEHRVHNTVSTEEKDSYPGVSDTLQTEKCQYFVFLTGKPKENGAKTKHMAY